MAQIRVMTNRLINTDLECSERECRRKCLDLIGSKLYTAERKLQNEQLHDFYVLSNINKDIKSGRIGMDGICDRHGNKNACKIFMEKPQITCLETLGIDGRITNVGGLKNSQPRPQMATISARLFFLSWYICHKHPCEIASHSIKLFVLYSCLKQEGCLYPLKWIKLSIVQL